MVKNKRAVTMCAHRLAQFLLVTQDWTCLGRSALGAAFEHGDSSCLCFCDHVSNKCYHSAGIQMFERRQLLLVKVDTEHWATFTTLSYQSGPRKKKFTLDGFK